MTNELKELELSDKEKLKLIAAQHVVLDHFNILEDQYIKNVELLAEEYDIEVDV